MPLSFASWNVNSLKVRQEHVLRYLETRAPTLLGLQELKQLHSDPEPFLAAGWHFEAWGQKTYNGVALISREPLTEIQRGLPNFPDDQARLIAATCAGLRVVNVYVPNGQALTSEKFVYKLQWLAALRDFLRAEQGRYGARLIVMGDFNIAPTDADLAEPERWGENLICSTPERAALADIFALGLVDGFRALHPETLAWSWWDYRQAAFARDLGLRIDLILHSAALKPQAAGIDREERARPRPSDHAPVWLSF